MNEIENKYQEPEQLDPGMKMLMTDDERDPLEAVEPAGFAGLVSIIVPVYNAEKYLEYTVQSILRQTYPHFELLLVNDGSTDGSAALCDGYAAQDSRVRAIHKANDGVSATRNRGLEEAKGDFIVFVDSDDLIQKRMLEKMVAAITNYRTDLVISGFDRFWPNWKNNFRISPYSLVIFQSRMELASVYNKPATNMFGVSIWAKMYRRSIIEENHIRFRLDTNYEEDCLFNLDYFRYVTTTAVLRDYFYLYRQQEQSLSKGYRKNSFQFLVWGYQGRQAFLKELGMEMQGARNIFAIVVKNTIMKIFQSDLSTQEKLEEYRYIMGFEESQDACRNSLRSRSRLTKSLSRAVVDQNAEKLHRVMLAWSVCDKTVEILRTALRRVRNRLRKIKRSLIK